MPAASATRPIRPSSASISRTRWPLPRPPIAGLQDIAPILSALQRDQRGARAATRSRSSRPRSRHGRRRPPRHRRFQPFMVRFLAPTDRAQSARSAKIVKQLVSRETWHGMFRVNHGRGWQSNCFSVTSLADAELGKDHIQQILDIDRPGNPTEGYQRHAAALRHEFQVPAEDHLQPFPRRFAASRSKLDMPQPAQARCCRSYRSPQRPAFQSAFNKLVNAQAGHRRDRPDHEDWRRRNHLPPGPPCCRSSRPAIHPRRDRHCVPALPGPPDSSTQGRPTRRSARARSMPIASTRPAPSRRPAVSVTTTLTPSRSSDEVRPDRESCPAHP